MDKPLSCRITNRSFNKARRSLTSNSVLTIARLEKRNRDLSAINAIASQTSRSLEIDKIIERTIEEMKRIFDATGISIYLFEEVSQTLQLAGQWGMPKELQEESQQFSLTHPFGRMIASDELIFSGDFKQFSNKFTCDSWFDSVKTPIWFMTAIILIGGSRSGTVSVTRRSEYGFRDDEQALLIALNNQLSMALENARLHQSFKSRFEDLEKTKNQLSDTKNTLEALYQSEKEARQALENEINKRAEFFRALVHELKTPLTPIVASSETLMELVEGKTLRELSRNVYEGALRLNSRVDELLDISRGELGMLKVHLEPIDMALLLQDVESYIRPQVLQNRQLLEVEIAGSLPVIMGDEQRLRQVLLNLLNNAMKFTPERGKITLKAEVVENNLRIEVHDTGRGIDESQKERLFLPYNRIEDDRQHFSGLGLGLALCKKLIDLHGGNIWIESQKGKGTFFIFTLAVAKPPLFSNQVQVPAKTL